MSRSHTTIPVDSPDMRHAGAETLSLGLLNARNQTLALLDAFGDALHQQPDDSPSLVHLPPPLWTAGHAGWFQERWIGRNPQCGQGAACAPDGLRLGSIEPMADAWWDPAQSTPAERWTLALPEAGRLKAYLLDGLEGTLELLEKTPHQPEALYFFRLALFHEDACAEALVRAAQALGVGLDIPQPATSPLREPLWLPAVRWTLGTAQGAVGGGFVADEEQSAHAIDLPEVEIDAQPVSWSQFVEFADDGGYDRPELWLPAGWDWLQQTAVREGRRAPRHVTQIGAASGAVLQQRLGRAVRLAGQQAVTHVSWWEADAWCRWAGRRLPAEVEWDMAAHTAVRRGFRWGDVHEWTATTFRPYPGYQPGPWREGSTRFFGLGKVLRGASFATAERLRYPGWRGGALPDDDTHFVGFRSCAL